MLTDIYREDEIQALIALAELAFPLDNPNDAPHVHNPLTLEEVCTYFRRFRLDLAAAFDGLASQGLVYLENNRMMLTPTGKDVADEMRLLRPPIYYWYRDFYSATEHSRAFDEYSRRVLGANFGQHGLSDIQQIRRLLELLRLDGSHQVLDIGCGNGKMAEYISDQTQSHVTGIDYTPEAIEQAARRTRDKQDRLHFRTANLEKINFNDFPFDVIMSIDTIFFGRRMQTTLSGLERILKPTGRMAIFNGDYQKSEFLAALTANHLSFQRYDFSREHIDHMLLKHRVATELQAAFEQEGNIFVWENLMAESFADLSELPKTDFNPKTRYLYIVKKDLNS